jgi:hypothetical protein
MDANTQGYELKPFSVHVVPIEGYPNYAISSGGRIFNVSDPSNPRELKVWEVRDGSICVNLYLNGDIHRKRVRRLVALAYLPRPDTERRVVAKPGYSPRLLSADSLCWSGVR